jgi:hypothetical protein
MFSAWIVFPAARAAAASGANLRIGEAGMMRAR